MTHTPFPWPGSKANLTDWILSNIPKHSSFTSVFGGSGAVLFAGLESDDTHLCQPEFNDANEDICQFLQTLKEQPDELIGHLRTIPYSRELHDQWGTQYFDGYRPDDPIERASRFYFLRRTQYGADAESLTGFRATAKGRRNAARQWKNSLDRLPQFADLLQTVRISNRDYSALLDDLQQEWEGNSEGDPAFLYFDPPYKGTTHRYGDTAENFEYSSFLEQIKDFPRTPSGPLVMVSTDTRPANSSEYTILQQDHSHSMNAAGGTKNVDEYLVLNYDPDNRITNQTPSLDQF